MNLKYKVTLISAATLMLFTPAMGIINDSTPIVQAARKSQKDTIKLVIKDYGNVQLYSAMELLRTRLSNQGLH